MDLYIYYKVDPAGAIELASRVRAMQSALASRLGVAAALRRRPGVQDGRQTWMEIYPDAPGGFEAALAHAVDESGIAGLIAGPRHTEVFMEIQACA